MPKPLPLSTPEDGKLPTQPQLPVERLATTVAYGSMSPDAFERHLCSPTAPVTTTDPSVRLALGSVGLPEAFAAGLRSPSVRLAHTSGSGTHPGLKLLEEEQASLPALLVSYYYLEPFLRNRHRYHYRDWVMDSGAFSAHASGVEISLDAYIAKCKDLLSTDEKLTEVFALDVIGDWKAGIANTEKMWKAGVEAIPCFHYGEPWSILKGLAKDYPKVALGGCVGKRDKDKFASECFARVWPKKLHGFGFGSEKSLMLLPWHSVDATNWELGPCKFGRWAAFGNASISVRGSKQNLRAEVEWYLELERKARVRWKKEMQQLEESNGPTVRLAADCSAAGGRHADSGFGTPPTVRLAHKESNRPGKLPEKESNDRPTA